MEPKRTGGRGGRGKSWQGPDLLAFRGSRRSFPPHGSQHGTLESYCHLLAPQFEASLGLVWLTRSSRADRRGVEQLQAGPKLSGSGYLTKGSRMKSRWGWEDLVNNQDGQRW